MAKKDIPTLAAFIAQAEEKAGVLTVCDVTHPDAVDGAVHEGSRSGIRLHKGDAPGARLSDGTVI